jgi:sulfite reductase (NADPH) flavoprotein alpha-component
VHLLIRQIQLDAEGEVKLGLGSGWLTHDASLNEPLKARIKPNTGFHYSANSAPLILIGNGTGIAGLRSHLKQRIAQGHRRNWLIFGERNLAHDFYYGDELSAREKQGWITTLDSVFSRDQVSFTSTEKHYVQHRLQQRSEQLIAWIEDGAAILICGSLQGMAAEVDAVLREIVGDAEVDQLIAQRRYLRDVY